MRGRISAVFAGLAIAVGGGVAGATLVQNSPDSATPQAAFDPTAAQQAIESGRIAQRSLEHALHVAQRARRIGRNARNKARTGLALAQGLVEETDQALDQASDALTNSNTALARADGALSLFDATEMVSDTVNGVATSDTTAYVRDGSSVGPQVTVTVPPSGFIEVWASVHVDDVEGAVGLFEDGQLVSLGDQIGGADCGIDHAILGTTGAGPVSLSTAPAFDGSGLACGTIGNAPSPILFNRSPGQHTYELRYADCGCFGGPSTFSERTLRVAPRL